MKKENIILILLFIMAMILVIAGALLKLNNIFLGEVLMIIAILLKLTCIIGFFIVNKNKVKSFLS